jgi:hypothetical protein
MSPRGGSRPGSGRKHRNSARLECSVPTAQVEEPQRRQTKTGVYYTRIASIVLLLGLFAGCDDFAVTSQFIGRLVDQLTAVRDK